MHAEEPNPSNLDSPMAMLAHKDGLIRKNAREALEEILRSESPEHSGALLLFGADNC